MRPRFMSKFEKISNLTKLKPCFVLVNEFLFWVSNISKLTGPRNGKCCTHVWPHGGATSAGPRLSAVSPGNGGAILFLGLGTLTCDFSAIKAKQTNKPFLHLKAFSTGHYALVLTQGLKNAPGLIRREQEVDVEESPEPAAGTCQEVADRKAPRAVSEIKSRPKE